MLRFFRRRAAIKKVALKTCQLGPEQSDGWHIGDRFCESHQEWTNGRRPYCEEWARRVSLTYAMDKQLPDGF